MCDENQTYVKIRRLFIDWNCENARYYYILFTICSDDHEDFPGLKEYIIKVPLDVKVRDEAIHIYEQFVNQNNLKCTVGWELVDTEYVQCK